MQVITRNHQKFLVLIVASLFCTSFLGQFDTATSAETPTGWVAHPMWIAPLGGSSTPYGYSPSQMRTAYNLPSFGGAGTTIAIIDAYDTPNVLTYFNYFSNYFGLPNNSTGNFIVHKMSESMGTDSSWAMETCLDVEWAHAIAPNAKILLVEATQPTDIALLAAVDYATSQLGVVAVSMSWGGDEFSGETSHETHFNKPGITFFASSGDDGAGVSWPAASSRVVGVGGTSLTLNPDGSVVSETGWSGSGGGVSAYFSKPSYQTSYGLNYSNRAVPDVSYSANPSTGVSVYNDGWYKVGGTSAGAPQWAAIHALSLTVSNANLYARAASSYSTHFRDITSGSNGAYTASAGYDLVTGLGSPITSNFGTEVTVSPTSGPPSGSITLNGIGFTAGSSVNISYLNPVNSSWITLINNYATPTGEFAYTLNAPDLLRNNPSGDNPAQSETLTFKVTDNSNGHSYNSTNQYVEWRRGLNQVGSATAGGLFGNNTDLSRTVFVNNGQSITLGGRWFNPGSATILLDGTTSLGTATVDADGMFSKSIVVPTTSAGQHSLIIQDAHSDFRVNITRLPAATDNYTDAWRTANFTVNLTADLGGTQIYYRINGGSNSTVSANGQPRITVEGVYPLEYWLVWDVYGFGSMELTHSTVTVKLDSTAPNGTVTTSSTTSTPTIMLSLSASDATSGVAFMRFSNDNSSWSTWEAYAQSKTWTLTGGDGLKTVYVQYQDNANLTSPTYSCNVTLDTTQPTPSPTPMSNLSDTTESATPDTTTSPSPTPSLTQSQTPAPSSLTTSPVQSVTPEAMHSENYQSPGTIVILIALFLFLGILAINRKTTP